MRRALLPDAEDWYANLLWFDQRMWLLLTHAATLFSLFEADVRAVDLLATRRLVAKLVERELRPALPAAGAATACAGVFSMNW